ncbi:MAG: peptidylprolyl isomerase [Gammaproteobacteria bacterium]
MRFFLLMVTMTIAGGAADAAIVEMQTSKGDLLIELDERYAPDTAANFLEYVDAGFFDGLIFHRVIPGFVIQGGGFSPDMQQKKTRNPIDYEHNELRNRHYTLSMARTSDPHSATSQFFINLADNAFLDPKGQAPGYAVFGKVVQGTQVVDAIAQVGTHTKGGHQDVPIEPITIVKAFRVGR